MKKINFPNLLKVSLLCTLIPLATHLFGQGNLASHTKKKVRTTANNNGATLKETDDWIVEKLNNFTKTYLYSGELLPNSVVSLVNDFTEHKFYIANDSLIYTYERSDVKFSKSITIIKEYDSQGNQTSPNTSYYKFVVPIKDIINVDVIEKKCPSINYPFNPKDSVTVDFLKINAKNIKWVWPNHLFQIYKEAISNEIPVDFSKEENLQERLMKAFNHLLTFYNHPKVKPKVKEVF
jgi:hypothetical protein